MEPVSPGCVAYRAVTTAHPTRFLAPIDCLKIPALDCGLDCHSNQQDRIQRGVLHRETVCRFIQVF
jgi:hypothetical protein